MYFSQPHPPHHHHHHHHHHHLVYTHPLPFVACMFFFCNINMLPQSPNVRWYIVQIQQRYICVCLIKYAAMTPFMVMVMMMLILKRVSNSACLSFSTHPIIMGRIIYLLCASIFELFYVRENFSIYNIAIFAKCQPLRFPFHLWKLFATVSGPSGAFIYHMHLDWRKSGSLKSAAKMDSPIAKWKLLVESFPQSSPLNT